MDLELIHQSPERVAETHGDPTSFVYKRLFAKHPEMEPLFLLDKDNAAKGNMLTQVFEVFLDRAGDNHYAENLVLAELINHDNLGVPPEVFSSFFSIVLECFEEILGKDLTPDQMNAWRDLVASLENLSQSR